MESRCACSGVSDEVRIWRPRTCTFDSAELTSLSSRALTATSCSRLSRCAFACSRSASFRSVSADVPHAVAATSSAARMGLTVIVLGSPMGEIGTALILPNRRTVPSDTRHAAAGCTPATPPPVLHMRLLVGTSGYNFPEWKGSFYPPKLPTAKWLEYYASKLGTVEINYTFYRMPTPKIVAGWDAVTPPGFSFVLKAPQRITHIARLKNVDENLRFFLETARGLGPKLGPILFQLP